MEDMMESVIGFDPGGTTGVCSWRLGRERPILQSWKLGPELWKGLELLGSEWDLAVIEDWRLYAGRARALTGKRIVGAEAIGAITAWAWRIGLGEVIRVQPATKVAIRAQMKARGIEEMGRNQHERDAHVLVVGELLRRGVRL